jgi:hypothetical protein
LYHLILHVGDTDFSIGIQHGASGDLAHLFLYEYNIHQDTSFPAFNPSGFAEKKVFINTSKYTLVPSVVFKAEEAENILSAVSDITDCQVHYQHISALDSYVLYAVHKPLMNRLEKWLGHFEVQHHISALLTSQTQYYLSPNVYNVFLDFNNTSFTQTVFDGKKLLHINTFAFKNRDDIMYYAYYSLEQLGLMPNDVELNLSGVIPDFETLIVTFQKYSQRVFELTPKQVKNIGARESRSLLRLILNMQCG